MSGEVPRRDEERAEQRAAWRALLLPAFFAVLFPLCYLSAFHAPAPHHVPVAVVGTPAQTAPLRAALSRVGSGFDVSAVATVGRAERALRRGQLRGALVPASTRTRTDLALVHSAGSPSLRTPVERLLRGAAEQRGSRLAVRDLGPLPPADASGTSAFYFFIVCTLGGYLTVTVLGQAAPTLRPRRRYPVLLAAAAGTPLVAFLVGGPLLGAYDPPPGGAVALIALGALYAFVVAVVSRLLQVLLGPAAIFATMLVFVFLNFPSAGGAVAPELLPGFWRAVHGFWVGAPASDAFRSVLYAGGRGVATDVLRLLAWLLVAAALLVLPASRKLERGRRELGPALAPASA